MGCCGYLCDLVKIFVLFAIMAFGISDCVSDWQLYYERDEQIEDICNQAETEICSSTKVALNATFVFTIFGTILVVFESINILLDLLKLNLMHPVFLSIIVCIFEELPLAGLRWNLKTSANNELADGWGITSGIFGILAPLLGPIYRCCKLPCCKKSSCSDCCKKCLGDEEKTCCDGLCSERWEIGGAFFLFLLACGVGTLVGLNWADIQAPSAELCV